MVQIPKQYQQAPIWTLIGQLGLMLGIAISTFLLPRYLMTGGGISNYGVQPQTVAYYTTGFILASTGALASSYLLQGNTHHNSKLVSRSLIVLSALYILVLISTYPYQLSPALNYIHQAISTTLYIYMTGLGTYLTYNMPRTYINRGLRYLLLSTLVVAILTYSGVVSLLFFNELMTGIVFGTIMFKYLRLIDK